MSLAKRTFSGIIWHFTQLLVRRSINLVVMLLLARILVPEDFGLMAMMTVFLAIGSSLMNFGFKQALIRMQGATQVDFNTAFYANLILGLLSFGILYLFSPLIADFYNEPRLIDLIRVSALGIIINSFQVVQNAKLQRGLNFKAEFQAIIPAGILSGGSAIIMAYFGYGVWVLVIQALLFSLVNTVFLWLKQGWRPSLSFSGESLGNMYDFGYRLFLTGVLDTIFRNIYVIFIAKFFDALVTGHYFFAEKIKDMVINQLLSSIQTVTYSTLANLHDEDERLKAGYRKVISVTSFVLFPVMTLLAALSVPIFEWIMPSNWMPAAPYLQLLCLAGLLDPVTHINSNLLKVKGRSDLYLYLEILKKTLVLIVFGLSIGHGINAILIGQIASSILIFIPSSYFSSKLINYSIKEQITDFSANLLLSFIVGLSVFVVVSFVSWEPFVNCLVFGLISPMIYFFIAYRLKFKSLVIVRGMVGRKPINQSASN